MVTMRKRKAPLLLSKSLSALGSQELAQGAAERHDTMLMYLLHDLRLGERCRLLQCLSILSAISSNIVFVLVLAGFRAASYSDESSRRAHLGTSSIPFAPMAEFYGTSVQQKKVPRRRGRSAHGCGKTAEQDHFGGHTNPFLIFYNWSCWLCLTTSRRVLCVRFFSNGLAP